MNRPLIRGYIGIMGLLFAVALVGGGCSGKSSAHKNLITIASKPEVGASVIINGVAHGETPVTLADLAPGAVLIELNKDGYKDAVETVRIPEEGTVTFQVPMKLLVGRVSIDSNPAQAELYLDDSTFLGLTPVGAKEIAAGEHNFELRKEHFQPKKFSLLVQSDYEYKKEYDLTPLMSHLEVYSLPTGANIWLNNQAQEKKTPAKFSLIPGSYTVSVHTKGYIANEEVVVLNADETKKLELKLVEGNVPQGMVLIPAGEFQFGADNQAPDERPKRMVFLPAFYIDKYEVTNAAFKAVYASHRFPSGQENYPVTKVSWEQASAYALAAKKRLPTEAEWEKACRGVDGRVYPWGQLFDATLANTGETPNAKLMEVGQFRPGASPFGCLDMCGNAYEWTSSWYAAYPGNSTIVKEYGQLYRVLRGGSYMSSSFNVRCTSRHFDLPDHTRIDYGFRCALSAEGEADQDAPKT